MEETRHGNWGLRRHVRHNGRASSGRGGTARMLRGLGGQCVVNHGSCGLALLELRGVRHGRALLLGSDWLHACSRRP